jgi:hypothetical protein
MSVEKFSPLSSLEIASIRMLAKYYSNGICHWCGKIDGTHLQISEASFKGPCLMLGIINGLLELSWTIEVIHTEILKVYK